MLRLDRVEGRARRRLSVALYISCLRSSERPGRTLLRADDLSGGPQSRRISAIETWPLPSSLISSHSESIEIQPLSFPRTYTRSYDLKWDVFAGSPSIETISVRLM